MGVLSAASRETHTRASSKPSVPQGLPPGSHEILHVGVRTRAASHTIISIRLERHLGRRLKVNAEWTNHLRCST